MRYTYRVLTQSTHATLLKRLSAGENPTAWREFCDRYGELIRGFAKRQGLQPSDCDDVVQETLLALIKSMPKFQYEPGKGKFRSYLKTIVLHVIFQRSRQKRGQVSLGEIEAAIGSWSDGDFADGQVAADPETEAQWEAEWRQYHLRRAMQTIEAEFNEKDRAAFDAYAVAGQGVRETAESLELTVDQVYQAKSRILKRLGQLVEQQVQEEG